MKKIKYLTLVIVLCCTFALFGCYPGNIGTGNSPTDVTNKVTNEITQTVVDYNSNITIEDLEDAVTVASKMVENAVIGVTLKKITKEPYNGRLYEFEDAVSVGSGVIYKRIDNKDDFGNIASYTYYVVTNAHVITSEESGEHRVYAYLGNQNTEVLAEVLGCDEKMDLAVIKFSTYYLFEPVEFQDIEKVEKGNFVIAVGNPDGYDYYGSVTFGVVSNLGRYISFDTDGDGVQDYYGQYVQTDAAINPGNSGGGLFTLDGKLVGINSIKLASDKIDNMGFAIPADIVKYAIENYLEKGIEILRPRLGVTIVAVRDMTSEFRIEKGLITLPDVYKGEMPYGIYIESFGKNGTLVNKGLHSGDIILEFDGHKLYESSTLSGYLNSMVEYPVGKTVEITYYCCKSKQVEKISVQLTTGD